MHPSVDSSIDNSLTIRKIEHTYLVYRLLTVHTETNVNEILN